MRAKSMKQSEDPESTKALTGTRIGGSESLTYNNFKQVSVATPRHSIISLAGFKQLTPQGVR